MGTSFGAAASDQDGSIETRDAFVGRRRQLTDLRNAMSGSRLVTLSGGPGVGKTRLAQEYAKLAQSAYEHGGAFVDLRRVPAGDTALLEQAVASAVRLPSQSARDLRTSLMAFLRDRRMLLILDNCEHLKEDVGGLVDTLLRGAPQLRVLATSRELLGLIGEMLIMVPPLELPDEDGPLNPKVEAVQLLVERAHAGVPGWSLTEQNWPAVRLILRSVGGLPLGIELVVGQMRSVSPEAIAARLDRSPHQQALNELIGPSYRVCEPAEQLLLAALSVFTGPFDLEAAEQVCADEKLPERAVAEALAGLVDRSLVVPSPSRTHYTLLEPVVQFAAQRLHELPDAAAAVRQRHRDHYRHVAARHAAGWRGGNEMEVLRAVEVDMPNLRAALGALLADPACAGQGLEMAVDVARTRWWTYSGRLPEQSLWLNRALQATPAVASVLRASAIALDAWMMLCLGEGREAVLRRIADAEAMAPTDEQVAALLFIKGAQVALLDGDRSGMDLLRQSHRLWLSYGPDALVDAHLTETLLTIGSVLVEDAEEGRRAAQEFLAGCERLGAEWGMAWARWCQAVALVRFDDEPRAAVRVLLDGVRGQQRINDRWTPLFTLPVLAWALARCGRRSAVAAARLLGAADGLHQATGIQLSRDLRVFALVQENAEAAVAQHLSPEQYEQARDVRVGTVDDAVALVLNGRYADAPDDEDESAADRPASNKPAGGELTESEPRLTATENEVAKWLIQGLGNKAIADKLYMSHRTVESHVRSMRDKVGAANRVELATRLIQRREDH
ncbi:helix-turn-helix transcriptional regulator [Saccharothrix stipae]